MMQLHLDFGLNQKSHLIRVRSKVTLAIESFFARMSEGDEFHAQDLRDYVTALVPGIAPASPDRILRDMRQRGEVDYVVVSRKDSLYRKVGP
jgi:hypothetical protein